MTRRHFIPVIPGAVALPLAAQTPPTPVAKFKQAVCRSVFGRNMDLDSACKLAASLGIQGFDLMRPPDWPILKKHGLVPSMIPSASGIREGINQLDLHDKLEAGLRVTIQQAADYGAPNVILLSGERKGLTDEQGLDNTVKFCNRLKAMAEDKGVTLALELLNSKVNHPGYQCDSSKWGVEVCKRVGSPRVKLLFDIYHMQIMEGDIIRTIQNNHQWIAHYHTAGIPGRHELNDKQELYYPAVARAIAETGYTGYIAHEYSPLGDPEAGLKQAIAALKW